MSENLLSLKAEASNVPKEGFTISKQGKALVSTEYHHCAAFKTNLCHNVWMGWFNFNSWIVSVQQILSRTLLVKGNIK
jgi:pheromone shutdown protein TraB